MNKSKLSEMAEAYLAYRDITLSKKYVKALYFTQAFEAILYHLLGYLISSVKIMVLKEANGVIKYEPKMPDINDITLHQMYIRLQTFLGDNKYQNLMKAMETAIDKRNKFIHETFVSKKNSRLLPVNSAHLDKSARATMETWIKSFYLFIEESKKSDGDLNKLRSL